MNSKRKWIACFSQTGKEIALICKKLGRIPDKIITNQELFHNIKISNDLLMLAARRMIQVDKNPTIEDYRKVFEPNAIITLNGWLRIVPPEICSEYEIYNGHPGDIVTYPELKGKDPQQKAFDMKLKESGCVIHKVTPELDSGEVIKHAKINIENLNVPDIINVLRVRSVDLWADLLKEKLK